MNQKSGIILFLILYFFSSLNAQDGLPIFISDDCVVQNESFCVDISVAEFDSVVSMQFSMNWDSTLLQYVSSDVTNMPDPGLYGDFLFQPGTLTVSWNADQAVGFASVPDGTSLFQICFTAIGIPEPDTCTSIGFVNLPLNIEVVTEASNGMNIGLDITEGNICIVQPLDIVDTLISHTGCVGDNSGALDITMNGGLPPYTYNWEGPGLMADTEDLSDLPAGMYYCTVTDTGVPNHVMMDSFEILAPAFYPAIAGPDTTLTCENSEITLTGDIDPNNPDIFAEWYTMDGNFTSPEFVYFVDVDQPGTYCFVTLSGSSLCADTSCLEVVLDTDAPIANAGVGGELTCGQTTLMLDGGGSIGDDLLYVWTIQGTGGFESSDSIQTPTVNAPGTYVLTVIDTLNGCESLPSAVIVTQDAELPMAFAGNDTLITCSLDTINLNGTGSSTDNVTYQWSTNDGNIIADETTLFPLIDEGGLYQLIVTNGPGCSDTSFVFVLENMEAPVADAGPIQTMLCGQIIVLLNGSGSDQGTEFIYNWTTSDGLIFEGETTLSPEVGAGGTYELEVIDTLNGCNAFSTVMVEMDTVAPVVNIVQDPELNCNITSLMLDATNSSSGTEFTYEWNTVFGCILAGDDTNTPTVGCGGVYVVLIQDTLNNCVAAGTVNVQMDTMPPLADPGMDTSITCGQPLILDGSNSGQGADVTYEWQTSGGNIQTGANTSTPTIDAGGTYTLITFNNMNGCSDTASVFVDGGAQLVDPDVGMDFDLCEDSTLLMANQPMGTTGLWTSNSNGTILIPDSIETLVQQLEAGAHIFVWTLSTDECPDYASDSLVVQVEGSPVANSDMYTFFSDLPVQELLLTDNDEIADLISWEVTLINEPTEVTITETANGVYDLTNPDAFFGVLEMEYELCSEICPTICDTAVVLITIEEALDTITTIPNAITPNGDGLNDFFVIPEISMEPESYPENELLIFNRWGDEVYHSKPYNNDWGGTDNSGNELPQGTYYFLMRLNVATGLEYKGDVTILK